MFALKLTQIGNSVGLVLPKEALAMLHVDKGDTVYLVESTEGFSMTPSGHMACLGPDQQREKRRAGFATNMIAHDCSCA